MPLQRCTRFMYSPAAAASNDQWAGHTLRVAKMKARKHRAFPCDVMRTAAGPTFPKQTQHNECKAPPKQYTWNARPGEWHEVDGWGTASGITGRKTVKQITMEMPTLYFFKKKGGGHSGDKQLFQTPYPHSHTPTQRHTYKRDFKCVALPKPFYNMGNRQ